MPQAAHQAKQALQGLSSAQAALRLAADGPNALPPATKSSLVGRIGHMLHEPMFVLLLVAAVLYIVLGDLNEGLVLAVFVLAVLALTLYQEGKSANSIEALRAMHQHQARVLRDGAAVRIPASQLVVGDLVLVAEGDRVAADGVLLEADNIEVDESMRTGESIPVAKAVMAEPAALKAHIFSGTHLVRGHGIFCVTAIGAHTEIGKIGSSLSALDSEATPLQKQTAQLVRVLATLGLGLCAAMVLLMGWRNGQWLPALLSGIALAMAMLPEEYPVVLAIIPALGAHRLAQVGVLTRHINAIETLGATSVLCTDKTGTLTHNRMSVQALALAAQGVVPATIYTPGNSDTLPADFAPLVQHAVLASAQTPTDPMEIAFHAFASLRLDPLDRSKDLYDGWHLVQSYPLSTALRAMAHVWQHPDSGDYAIAAKGAPEAIMHLCHMASAEQDACMQQVEAMGAQGLRVLAVARGQHAGGPWPKAQHDFDFQWLGLIGLADPLREEVPQAMAQCQAAGIRVIMVTGDHPATAQVIAQQAGMLPGALLMGDAIELLSDSALADALRSAQVCARISPHQKLRIVQALKRNGEIVTRTGDGVNDAPALRAAHVGVAMGARGTDVAREAADLVLVDDNFASIVRSIRIGRRIFSNLQKSMAYIFAIHIPIAMLALVPMLFALPPLFLPLHIALLEMVIDPACSLAFENEPESAHAMSSPPRDTRAPLFSTAAMARASVQGLWVLLSAALAYGVSTRLPQAGDALGHSRTMVMVAFVVANGWLIFIAKAQGSRLLHIGKPTNRAAVVIAIGTVALVLLAIYVPWLAAQMKFYPLGPQALTLAMACGSLGLVARITWDALAGRTKAAG